MAPTLRPQGGPPGSNSAACDAAGDAGQNPQRVPQGANTPVEASIRPSVTG